MRIRQRETGAVLTMKNQQMRSRVGSKRLGSSALAIKHAQRFPTHQAIQQREAQLEECLEQMEAEPMRLATLLTRHGAVAEVTKGRKDGAFCKASRQLASF